MVIGVIVYCGLVVDLDIVVVVVDCVVLGWWDGWFV